MSESRTIRRKLGAVFTALNENVSDSEMDRLLAERHDEIEELLGEARACIERGEIAPLEPLDVFLRRARERFMASP
jgi:hypothetical protein